MRRRAATSQEMDQLQNAKGAARSIDRPTPRHARQYYSAMACHICSDNASQDIGGEMWGVARLTTGYVRLNPNQYFRGSCFFLATSCVHELHDLGRSTRDVHLGEMAEVAAAIWTVFSPKKLNYEALGNGAPHLHWWLTPRYESDPRPFAPIWEDLEFLRAQWTNGCRPTDEERDSRRSRLLTALESRDVDIELPYRRT
jgi:diadenosine tetraphosphate (Ap4A) HIT family hydrolase